MLSKGDMKRKPYFCTEPSTSSLVHDRKRNETPRCNEKNDKSPTPRFYDKSIHLPDKTTKVAIFDSSGVKTDAFLPDSTDHNFKICDLESVQNSERNLLIERENELNYLNQERNNFVESSNRKNSQKEIESRNKIKRQSLKTINVGSKTKIHRIRKKRSKTDLKYEKSNPVKETSTESIIQNHVTTQTEQPLYCRRCQQTKVKVPLADNSSVKKIEMKSMKPTIENQNSSIESNAFCTAVSVTPSNTDEKLLAGPSRINSPTDVANLKRGNTSTLQKRTTYINNETIHQEIMNLKKSSEYQKLLSRKEYSTLDPIPFRTHSRTGELYRQFKKANENGTLRYVLSMFIFGILLFWLISATFSLDFILEIFRVLGRYFSSLPIFIRRKKRELTKAEIAVKYMASFAKGLRTVLTGTDNSDADFPDSSEVETIDTTDLTAKI